MPSVGVRDGGEVSAGDSLCFPRLDTGMYVSFVAGGSKSAGNVLHHLVFFDVPPPCIHKRDAAELVCLSPWAQVWSSVLFTKP